MMPARMLRWLLIAAIALLASGELLARYYFGLGDPPLSQTHPTIEYYFKPNQNARPFGNVFRTNRYGMRSDDFPPQKRTPAELRILVYGDSVVNGGNLTDHSRLATTYLQTRLANDLRRPVVVGNISAGSWGPPNELAYLRQFGFLDADIVVLVLSSSDYDDVPTFEPLNPLTHPTQAPVSALWDGITRYLPRYINGRVINESGAVPDAQHVPNKTAVEVSLSAEREFLATAKAQGVKALVVQHWMESELHSQPLPGHAEIRRVASEAAVAVSDDAGKLQAFLDAGKNPYRDDIHLNDAGQVALAELLLEEFRHDFADLMTVPATSDRAVSARAAQSR